MKLLWGSWEEGIAEVPPSWRWEGQLAWPSTFFSAKTQGPTSQGDSQGDNLLSKWPSSLWAYWRKKKKLFPSIWISLKKQFCNQLQCNLATNCLIILKKREMKKQPKQVCSSCLHIYELGRKSLSLEGSGVEWVAGLAQLPYKLNFPSQYIIFAWGGCITWNILQRERFLFLWELGPFLFCHLL